MQIKSLFEVLAPMGCEAVPQGKEKHIFDGHTAIINGKEVFIRRENKHAANH